MPRPRQILLPFLLSRFWVALWVYIGHLSHPYLKYEEGNFLGVRNWWLNPWTNFDSQYYLQIAQSGYDAKATAFQPLYPLLLRLAGRDPIALAAWGVVLSNLCFLAALGLLWVVTQRDYDEKVARRAVWILAFYPTAAIFSSVYTESLFAVLIFAFFLLARDGRWWATALCGAGAALTRNAGPMIGLAAMVEAYVQIRKSPPVISRKLGMVVAAVAGPACFVGLQLYYKHQFGAEAGTAAYKATYRAFTIPFLPLAKEVWYIASGQGLDLVTILNFAATVGFFVLAWKHRKDQPAAYLVFGAAVMFLHMTYARQGPSYTNSSLRYLSTALPFIQMLALEVPVLAPNRIRKMIFGFAYVFICALFCVLYGMRQYSCG